MPIIQGNFKHLVYSPRGAIEGVLVEVEGAPAQFVFAKDDEASSLAFMSLKEAQALSIDGTLQGPSKKGASDHAVYAFNRLLAIDGKKPQKSKPAVDAGYRGTVVRLNFARHGAANGVVLDSGDFIHTQPEGMAKLKLKVGDSVRAEGDAQQLVSGSGWAVEADKVNGKTLHKK